MVSGLMSHSQIIPEGSQGTLALRPHGSRAMEGVFTGAHDQFLSHVVLSDPVRVLSAYHIQSDYYRTLYYKIVKNYCFKGRKLRPSLSDCFFPFMKQDFKF